MDLTQLALPLIYFIFFVGLVLLFAGGHFLVEGSSKLARILHINPVIVGLTIVAFGTSMPEFLVSIFAAVSGATDVALGNIIGSNVSNIGLILGVSALVRPIDINLKLLKFEIPLVIVVSALFWVICLDGSLGRLDGFLLLAGFAVYLYIVIAGAKKGSEIHEEKYAPLDSKQEKKTLYYVAILGGMVGLSIGASLIVEAATEVSHRLGVSELALGLTVVALGTSLPELATSVVAAIKKEGDIGIGNIIGSNLFNMMAIAGPSALLHPLPVSDEIRWNQLPIMVGLTALMFPLLRSGRKLTRIEGGLLLGLYCCIMLWWVL